MALDTLEKLSFGLQNRYITTFSKASASNMPSGGLGSRWRTAGAPPAGVLPTTAIDCSVGTVGAMLLPPIPEGNFIYIAELNVSQSVAGQFVIFDRLSHMGGLSGNIITLQTVDLDVSVAASQGRCEEDGSGVLWAIDTYTALGSVASTATFTYTNQADVSGRTTTVAIPATMRAQTIYPIMPNANDLRIKSIQSVQLNLSTGVVGNWGVTARTHIAELSIPYPSVNFVGDYATLALPRLTGMECLELASVCGTTSSGQLVGNAAIIRTT